MTRDAEEALTGGWQLRGCLGDTWRWLCGPGRPEGEPGWHPARVPGSVLDDLHRAGQVPDPYHGTQSLAAEWVPQRTWLYRRTLRAPGGPLGEAQRALLRFEGVDHDATVLLDGAEVARHEGMFTPFEVDVTRHVADGESHLLAVAVHPAPPSEPQVGRTDRVTVHKTRMNYGWDFCPRMIHQGIWRPVTLEIAGTLRPVSHAVSAGTDETGTQGRIRAEVRFEAAAGARGVLHTAVRGPDGGLVAEARQSVPGEGGTGGAVTQQLTVERPALWWPNGHGRQPLYDVTSTLTDADGNAAGRVLRATTGFRRVRLVPNAGAPADALPYTLEVNGRRIHTKGWNWVPMDAQYGVPRPARLEHLLRLAADAHVTLLRVWGGGLIESEGFYGLCDRLGLLVWQEFSLSSSGIDSVPSDDPGYAELLAREARSLLPRLRHHPALAVWGPGNELHDTAAARPLTEADSPAIAALADAVAEADPSRAWLPGSPSGPDFLHRADDDGDGDDGGGSGARGRLSQHDVHGPWEHQGLGAQQQLYDGGTCLLHSEFGVEGMANARTWDAVVPRGEQWPTGRDNPVMDHLGAWWNNTPLVLAAFGGRPPDVATVRRASQQLQYDGLRYAVEATLRRAPRASGCIPWQLDEPFPNAWCTAAVDHRGDPKPAYHGVRRAYRPSHVCASFATQAWGGRETFTAELWSWRPEPGGKASCGDADGTVAARLLDAEGTVHAECVLPEGEPSGPGPETSLRPARAGLFEAPLGGLPGDVFVLHLELRGAGGEPLATSRWVHSRTGDLAPLLDLPAAHVEALADPGLTAVHIRHLGGPAALGLYLTDARPIEAEGWAVFEDNMLDLLPGESVRVPVTWRSAPEEGRAVRLEGWNAGALELR
ncbi:glycoside hydrolase family 2 protein [Streptomyces winkii]|uniref:glycoside hydrolase family 2 protein n=1 Tax=Streptomyces winkii TaxID=3051178 RepID=UPI0028D192B4|nr:sugar-binding domain-containing protein [Streptomyces sp. DSM 40971]